MSLLVGTTTGLLAVGDTTEEVIGGTRINHISRSGDDWWAVDDKSRIYQNGEVVATLPDGAAAICIQPTPETIWIGSNQARLYALDHDEVTEDRFFADAPGRESWYTPWGAPADVRSIALDADHTLYVNVHVGGILRYDNTGVVPTVDISSDVHQVAAHRTEKGAVFAATARGLAFTHNGHDFEFRTNGLHATYCRAVAVMADRVFVSASSGPRTHRARVYASPLWEGPMEPVTGGLPDWFGDNVDTHCLTATGETVHLGHGDSIWRSGDRGDTWDVAASGLTRVTCIA